MPRSSRHKSSKHSSREVRDYSDSEKDPGLKEKKGRDEGGSSSSSRHAKEFASGEKRKLESKSIDIVKESVVVVNVGYTDEYGPSSLKKRKDKVDDDRWTGGDNEHELLKGDMKEMKTSSDSRRSSRRDENIAPGVDGEEGKRSGSKVESKSHRSDRKERSEKEGASERERKVSKSERLVDDVLETDNIGNEGTRKLGSSAEERGRKSATGNTDDVRNSELERELDRRVRRKRDGSSDGDKHQDGVRELDDRRLSSKEDVSKSGKFRDDGHKDDRIRDKYREDVDKDHVHPDERLSDIRHSRDYTRGRSDDKHLRNEKKDMDMSQKKPKPHSSEYDRDRDRDHDRDRDRDHDRDRDRERDRGRHDRDRDRDDRDHDLDRDRDRDVERTHDRDRELDWDRERGRDRYRRERERDRIRDRDHNHDRSRDRDYDHDQDYGSHIDDKGSRYKEDRGRRRSPDVYDDYHGDKSRRAETEADRERSLSRKGHVDSVTGGSRRRASPSSRSYVSTDKYRDGIPEDVKYGESSRDGAVISETNKVPKYRSGEKRGKFDDNHIGEYPERSPGAKASPACLKERSPSSTSVDRRFRTGRRGSLDVDETERRSIGSNDIRDVSVNEDRQSRDFSTKKPMGEEYPRAELSFHHKSSQGNVSSHGPSPSGFRSGADSPSFMGSLGDDSRGHSGSRYRRSVDPHVGRGPGNAWKGIPNWPSPLPNGFMPFPPGPPGPHHGGFPPMLSQFPPLFGVRPPLEMNHPGIPYHMGDADRFSGHVRPMGWQNMVDGSIPPHFHGWDANNGVLRDESSMYGPGHLSNVRGRDINEDMWKPNGNMNVDATSGSQKDASVVKASADEASSAQGTPRPHQKSSCLDDQGMSFKMNTSSAPSSPKEIAMTPAKVTTEKTPESSSVDDSAQYLRAYLAKLDISMDMADPELYNQCIDIAVKGEVEFVEDDVKLELTEEKAVAETEFTNLTMGTTIFPAAKDSIFQRALALYKTQSNERTTAKICNGEKLHSLSPAEPEVEQTMVPIPNEGEDNPVDCTVKQEDPSSDIAEEVPPTSEEEGILETIPLTNKEVLNEVPSPQGGNLALDVGHDEGDIPVLDVEKFEENIPEDLIPQNDVQGHLPLESTYSEAIGSNVDIDMVDNDGKIGGVEPSSGEQLDVKVSEPLILSNDSDSVKLCEVVSNDSESVILSRIHDAPDRKSVV